MNVLIGIGLTLSIFFVCTVNGYSIFEILLKNEWKILPAFDRLIAAFCFGSILTTLIFFIFNLVNFSLDWMLYVLFFFSLVYLGIKVKNCHSFFSLINTIHISKRDIIFTLILTAICIDVFLRSEMNADGFFWWGFKARILFEEHGSIGKYLQNSVFIWSHMDYPLFLPILEYWVYKLYGKVWEPYAALISPAFYSVLGIYLFLYFRKFSNSIYSFFFTMVLLMIPLLQEVSIFAYADGILALFYLIVGIFSYNFLRTKQPVYLFLSFIIAAGFFWIKKEGIILYGCFLLALLFFAPRQSYRKIFILTLVSLVPLSLWYAVLKLYHIRGVDFVQPSVSVLVHQSSRIPEMLLAMRRFLKFTPFWGIFWILFFVGLVIRFKKLYNISLLFLLTMIVLPLLVYPSIFIFSTWIPYYEHVRTALPRLILHVVPLAYIFLVMCILNRFPYEKNSHD